MIQRYLRVYKKMDIDQIKDHLIIYGGLAGNCSKCNCMGIKLDTTHCPECQTEFKFLTFRNISENLPKIHKMSETRPELSIIDYDDYRRITGSIKAEGLLGD